MEEYVEYFNPGWDGCEEIENYRKDGLPPIDLGNRLGDGRYHVIHKLGQGASATVWLAYDEKQNNYVAVKAFAAWAEQHEMKVQKHLLSLESIRTDPRISTMLDHFEFESPNGHHVGLVYEVAGPNLESVLQGYKIRPDYARKLARTLVEAVCKLHKNNIAYGDISTSNILIKYRDLPQNNPEKLFKLIGEPEMLPVSVLPGMEDFQHLAPRHQVRPVECNEISTDLYLSDIAIIDLNEATFQEELDHNSAEEDRALGVHLNAAAPEYVFGLTPKHTKHSDIWSLACCLFAIRASEDLISSGLVGPDPAEIGTSIQFLLGPLPAAWIEKIQTIQNEARQKEDPHDRNQQDEGQQDDDQSDEDREDDDQPDYRFISIAEYLAVQRGDQLEDVNPRDVTLDQKISSIGQWLPWITMTEAQRRDYLVNIEGRSPESSHTEELVKLDGTPPAKLSAAERQDFSDLLSKMLRLEPDERLTIEEVLEHPWLNTQYEDLDDYTDWICPLERGYKMKVKNVKVQASATVQVKDLTPEQVVPGSSSETESVEDSEDDRDTGDSKHFPASISIPTLTNPVEDVSEASYSTKVPELSVSEFENDKSVEEEEASLVTGPNPTRGTPEQGDEEDLVRNYQVKQQDLANSFQSRGNEDTHKVPSEQEQEEKLPSAKQLKTRSCSEAVPWWHGLSCIGVVLAAYGMQQVLRKMYE